MACDRLLYQPRLVCSIAVTTALDLPINNVPCQFVLLLVPLRLTMQNNCNEPIM
jgi:hypothetical protein